MDGGFVQTVSLQLMAGFGGNGQNRVLHCRGIQTTPCAPGVLNQSEWLPEGDETGVGSIQLWAGLLGQN